MKNGILSLFVAACFAVGCGWQGRLQPKKGDPRGAAPTPQTRQKAPEPVEVYKGLRGQFLKLKPGDIGPGKAGPDAKAYGVLMEMGLPNGLASIISLSTGEASLYTGTGGGVIGGGGHEGVRRAARALVSESDKHLPRMAGTKDFPYAEVGRIRFYVLTGGGVYTAEAGQEELAQGTHALSPLFRAGNEVITQLRLISEKKEQ